MEEELSLEQIAATWLRLWFLMGECGNKAYEVEAEPQEHNSRSPAGQALRRHVITVRGDAAVFTFTAYHGAGGPDDAPGHVLGYMVFREDEDENAPALGAEIDVRDDWARGTIVAFNQGRWKVTGNYTRLINPWRLILDTFTSGVVDAQRYLMELAENPVTLEEGAKRTLDMMAEELAARHVQERERETAAP